MILLNSLPILFDTLKDVIQYGRDDLTVTHAFRAIIRKYESLKVFKPMNKGKTGDVKTEAKSESLMVKDKGKG